MVFDIKQIKICFIQCKPDIRELSGPKNKYLISGFVYFVKVTLALIWDQRKSLLYQDFLYYPGYTVCRSWNESLQVDMPLNIETKLNQTKSLHLAKC